MRQSIWKKIVAAAAAAIVAMTLIGMGISCSYAYINQYRQQRHRDEAAMALCANQCQTLLNDVRMLAHSVAEMSWYSGFIVRIPMNILKRSRRFRKLRKPYT